ncbi:hypothetical protein TNCV_2063221 [Trichonephila clavipes]|nr:hypothetical protein TNCV_2063221 [Trichonephila clavipes]
MEVTRVEQRSYIKIAVLRGKNAMEYHSEFVEAHGNNALPYCTVTRWVYCVVILLHHEGHIALYTTGLGSNPGEGIDVCKCIVPSRHGDTINSRRAASSFVRLVEGGKRWVALTTPRFPSSKLGRKRAKSYCHLHGAQTYG